MRKILLCIWSIVSIFITGCNNESNEIPDISKNNELLLKNGISNVQAAYEYNINDKIWVHGLRNSKEWFALFESDSEELLEEWYGDDYSDFINENNYFISYIQHPIEASNGKYAIIKDEHIICNLNTNGQIEYQEIDKEVLNIPNLTLRYDKTIPVKSEGWFIFMETGHDFYHLLGFDGKLKVKNIYINNKDEFKICAGRKGDNLWVGLNFNNYSFEKNIEKNSYNWIKEVYKGYGEYQEYPIIGFRFYNSIETKNGIALIPIFYKEPDHINSDYPEDIGTLDYIWIINNENVIEVSVENPNCLSIWYDSTILVNNKYIISLDGDKLYEGFFPQDAHPISYTEYIKINGSSISRCSGISGEYKNGWSNTLEFIKKYPNDSRFTYTIIEETNTEITYCCDIVNYDGSKAQEIFEVNLTTGEIAYSINN